MKTKPNPVITHEAEAKKVSGTVQYASKQPKQKERKIEEQKNKAYHERDLLVSVLSKLYPAHLQRHEEKDKNWEDDWRWIVCIHIPVVRHIDHYFFNRVEQVTWHIHDSELELFDHLKQELNHWDGHNTEEKYIRLSKLFIQPQKKWWQFWKK